MGSYFSYNVVEVENVRKVFIGGEIRWVVDAQCKDEHGHALAPCRDVLCTRCGKRANFEKYAENLFFCEPDEVPDDEWKRAEALCENYPGYDVYNGEWLLSKLLGEDHEEENREA